MVKCNKCDGGGIINPKGEPNSITCPRCDGYGWLVAETVQQLCETIAKLVERVERLEERA